MRVVCGLRDVLPEAKGAALAIGNFDGVHRGHQAVLKETIAVAQCVGCAAGALVFEPHPRTFFHPKEPHFELTPLPIKLALFDELGLNAAVVLPFDAALASLPAEAFIEQVLVESLGIAHAVVGYDFFFGKTRGGSPETLKQAGERFGFGVTVVTPQAEGGEVFSSSGIRAKLAQGDVVGAADQLGRPWRVRGTVVEGKKRGALLGYPTANIVLPTGTALAHGIYAVRVFVDGARYGGAAYLGTRPTFDDGPPLLEVLLFDFDGDLYGREIEVAFVDFIREDRRFNTTEALQAQMAKDCDAARAVLAPTSSPLEGGGWRAMS